MFSRIFWTVIVLLLAGASPVMADTLYVDDNALPGGDGTTWLSAFNDLQLALDAAKASGGAITEIHVAAGTYRPTAQFEPGTPRTESFRLINNVALKGGYRGCPDGDCTGEPDERDITQYETILSGDLEGNDIEEDFPDGPTYEDNSLHVIYLPKGLNIDQTAILDGCTITAGNDDIPAGKGGGIFCEAASPTIRGCRVVLNSSRWQGGGICCTEGQMVVTRTTIARNRSGYGGGCMCGDNAQPVLSECEIVENHARYDGGGVLVRVSCSALIADCVIEGNTSESEGGGMHFYHSGSSAVDRCVIRHNTASGGSGVYCDHSGSTSFDRCRIEYNQATPDGGNAGIACYVSSPEFTNCLIVGNENAREQGNAAGALICSGDSHPRLTNCTIAFNTTEGSGVVTSLDTSRPELTNCILWGNTPQAISAQSTPPLISYSNIQGGWPGPGNIDVDPLFAFKKDPHLLPGSPCIDAGKNAPFMGFPVQDIEGCPRTLDGDEDAAVFIDMGALEFNPASPRLALSTDQIECLVSQEQTTPHAESFQIRNAATGTLTWDIHEDCPWLTATPQSGTSTGEINEITLAFDVTSVLPGQHECLLTITDPQAPNSPRTISIILHAFATLRVPTDYPTIQEAIDAAEPYDTVLIADGTYTGPGNRNLSFQGKSIIVRSENGPASCIIDCEQQGRGFAFKNGETHEARLQGLTIRGGYVDRESPDGSSGGGIVCYDSSPTIAECIITANRCDSYGGGGIAIDGDGCPEIRDCEISQNSACHSGGGVLVWQAVAPELRRCVIHGNTAMFGGGIGLSNWGPMKIIDCTICDNMAYVGGGGVGGHPEGQVSLSNCVLARNVALFGAAIDQEFGDESTISNCTIVHNRSAGGSGAIRYGGGDMTITNAIIYDNYPRAIAVDDLDVPTVTFSNIEGGWEGEGNIDEDPLFAFDRDYHLSAESPCIDAGSNASVPEETSGDIDGNPRLHDGDADGSAVVDMGAHEFNSLVPSLALSEELIEISIPIDEPSPKTVALGIRNSGGGTLTWQISEEADWLTIDTLTGSSTGETDEVLLTLDPAGLEVGTYVCPVAITAPESANEQRLFQVYLYIHNVLRVPSQYASVNTAVYAAESHDVVLLADGVHIPGDGGIWIGSKDITVRSENGPEHCVVDSTHSRRGFILSVEEDDLWESPTTPPVPSFIRYDRDSGSFFPYVRGPRLQGLTIRNASACVGSGGGVCSDNCSPTIRNCVIRSCSAEWGGGGISSTGYGWPTIENCLITACTAGSGGGIYSDCGAAIRSCEISMNTAFSSGGGVFVGVSYPQDVGGVIDDCHIHHNIVASDLGYSGYGGGGVCLDGYRAPSLIRNCVIEDNVSMGKGGGVIATRSAIIIASLIRNNTAVGFGGGLCWDNDGTMRDCRIEGNISHQDGGGLYQAGSPRFPATRCEFINNTAAGNGGGVNLRAGALQLAQSLIAGNTAGGQGGAIHIVSGDITLTNCTVANNTADTSASGLHQAEGSATIINSIFYGDAPEELVFESGEADVRYSLISGGWEGEGNIDVDPVFAFTEDYHILPTSPCIDAGEALSGSSSVFDLDGNPRPLDGDQNGTAEMDIGAFEFDPDFPSIAVSQGIITFAAPEEPVPFVEETFSIRNAGGGTLTWQIECDTPGLEITPTSGISTGEISDVLLKLDPAQYPVDQNETRLTVSCTEAINSPIDILLRFQVPQERHVPADYPTIQEAIDVAGPGDTIIIADGTYTGPGNRDIDFLGKPITVRSENGPETCIIDCEHTTQAFRFMRTEGRDSVLEGITIRYGRIRTQGMWGGGIQCHMSSPTIRNCMILDCGGGGLYCNNGSPLIEDCLFSRNLASRGGALHLAGSGSPEIRHCSIKGNQAAGSGSVLGAGIFVTGSVSPFIVACEIVENANTQGAGGGIYTQYSSATVLMDCRLHGNTAMLAGAGLSTSASVTLINTTITNNITSGTESGRRCGGGGVNCSYGSSLSLLHCLISGNRVEGENGCGGAIYTKSSALAVNGCTITNNYASIQGGAVFADEALPAVTNSILWGNTPDQTSGMSGDFPVITFSNIQGGFEGEGNIDADPLFLDPEGPDDDPATWEDNDFRLAAGSPCIDAANNLAVSQDEFDLDGDGDRTERIPFDLAGRPRFFDDTATPDTGIADPPDYSDIVDMGAYEHQPDRRRSKKLNRSLETRSRKEATRKPRPADIDRAGSRETTSASSGAASSVSGAPGASRATGGSPASASHALGTTSG